MDSVPLQNYQVVMANRMDWDLNKDKLKGSAVFDYGNYRSLAPVHVDDFSDSNRPLVDCAESDLVESGRDLLTGKDYLYGKNILTKTAVDTTQLYAVIGQKLLISDASGVKVV